jgi:hypothetical protein
LSKFVSESIIDQVILELEKEKKAPELILTDLKEEEPVLTAYLFSETFDIFAQTEKDYLLYLALVIWNAVNQAKLKREAIAEGQLGSTEEKNWEIFEEAKGKSFREKLDVFFEAYPQEDLLAFVEDALTDDEDNLISHESRSAAFISLKTIIDCLTNVSL